MSIATYDTQVLFSGLETLGWVVIIGLAVYTLTRAAIFPKAYKTLLLVIFGVWAFAYIGGRAVDTYLYFHDQRPAYVQASQSGQQIY